MFPDLNSRKSPDIKIYPPYIYTKAAKYIETLLLLENNRGKSLHFTNLTAKVNISFWVN